MSEGFKGLRLYNTLTRAKEDFVPLDPANVRMYVCGPTVYDYAHIGNARPAIVFDVLYRLLRHLYGADRVTYVRNITDVDDKINARALRDYGAEIAAGRLSLNAAIRKVTEPTYEQYQKDVGALGCLPPTYQPRATEFVLPRADGKADMVTLIQSLIDRGHAYVSNGEVLFDVTSMPDYGRLSKRPLDEQQAGARIAVEAHKKNPADFVLWKESTAEEPGWEAHFDLKDGSHVHIHGRPGWHIECSAMSAAYLGEVFDIHGGGLDLIFPHHENEIAQSRCAHGTEVMANYWLHNGFLQVEGRKMSKSEGNFVTIHELLETEKFGGPWSGIVLRIAMLMTHYAQPIDWTRERLTEARRHASRWNMVVRSWLDEEWLSFQQSKFSKISGYARREVFEILLDDLNSPGVVQYLSDWVETALGDEQERRDFIVTIRDLGFLTETSFKDDYSLTIGPMLGDRPVPRELVSKLATASANNNVVQADQYRHQIAEIGYEVRWLAPDQIDLSPTSGGLDVNERVARRLAFIAAKNWAEADRIRDELLAQGIQLKDGKDPATGERITTWEVKR